MFSVDDELAKPRDDNAILMKLAQRNNFNIPGAVKEGYSTKQIISYLVVKESNQDSYLELLLCPPKYLAVDIPNNRWMKKMHGEDKKVNIDKAMSQFHDMASLFAHDSLVYLMPPKDGLQDQVYITNAGVVLPHLYKTVVLANFKAEGRPGEEVELSKFMTLMNYQQFKCPFHFEGEAELKWLKDNVYIGGYGQRSEIKALEWIEKTFDCKVIKLKETDPLRYHLDCNVFSISKGKVVLSTDQLEPEVKKEIEKVVEIIPVSKKDSQWSLTNSIRIGSVVYNATDISELDKSEEGYEEEKHKNEMLEKICRDVGLELVFINLSEFSKSGAALSCCILHMTRIAYPD